MRRLGWLVVLVCGGLVAAADDKPLTPEEAIKKVNEKVVVRMKVKAAKNRLAKFGEIYLDSVEDYKDEKNLAVVITKKGAALYEKVDVKDPAKHFMGKTIEVTGKVTLKDERPRILIDDPKDITLVEKKD